MGNMKPVDKVHQKELENAGINRYKVIQFNGKYTIYDNFLEENVLETISYEELYGFVKGVILGRTTLG